MGTNYEQLSLEERCTIARLHADGGAIRQIAASLDRAPSTIARELKRNRGTQVGYAPAYAAEQAWARRWRGSRLARQPALQQAVLSRLALGWSPEQVAGRLAHEHARLRISHESIYRFIYAQIRRTNDFAWRLYLPRAKFKRGYRGRKGGSSVLHIKDRVPIADRPASIETRRQPGHWETDYLFFRHQGQAVLVAQERTSRLVLIA
jgi:IS30 family transposase